MKAATDFDWSFEANTAEIGPELGLSATKVEEILHEQYLQNLADM
jgi:hypothetical protein